MDDDVDLDMPSERLADEVTELAGHLAAATYRLLMMIGELDPARHVGRLGVSFVCPPVELADRSRSTHWS
jgi:hypothetical protein